MKSIHELIAELCPNGVEFQSIEDVFNIRNGYTPSKNNPEFWDNPTIPWFRMDDIRANGRVLSESITSVNRSALKNGMTFPSHSILVSTSATIGEHALIRTEHIANQRFVSLEIKEDFKECLLVEFFYYICFSLGKWCAENTTKSSFAAVDMRGFRKYRFPVPPLEVQHEIVRILDEFTQLQAELEAELEARRQQYEYYRDQLLTFPEIDGGGV